MATPTPPSLFWDDVVDPPVEQDADYELNDQDRAYIDSQIRALMTRVLALSGGLAFGSFTQDCTIGGTIASTAATGVGIITLTGAPGNAFTYSLPAGPGEYQIVNKTGQQVTVIAADSTAVYVNQNAIVSTDGTSVYPPSTVTTAQRINANSASKQIVVTSRGHLVILDTAAHGAFVALMPVGIADRQRVTLMDLSSAGQFCNWGNVPGEWSVLSGPAIELPSAPGTFITVGGTVTAPAAMGAVYVYEFQALENVWKLV